VTCATDFMGSTQRSAKRHSRVKTFDDKERIMGFKLTSFINLILLQESFLPYLQSGKHFNQTIDAVHLRLDLLK